MIFTGARADAVDLLRLFECFVSTSYFEGMPMALLEAMALGKPIVATAIGGVPEVVEDGQTGILIRSRDSKLVTNAIRRLLDDSEFARRLGQNGRMRYEQRFTAAAMASAYQSLYDDCVEREGVRP